jgi:uncharacterized integral membrane protein
MPERLRRVRARKSAAPETRGSPLDLTYRGRMAEAHQHQPEPAAKRSISPKVVLWTIVAVLGLILVFQNGRDVRINLLFWDVTGGLWIILVGAFLLGMLIGWLLPKVRKGRGHDEDDAG